MHRVPLEFSYVVVGIAITAAAESINPRYSVPDTTSSVATRIVIFYVVGALIIGFIVGPRNNDLVSAAGYTESQRFAMVIRWPGIVALLSVVNAAALVSAWAAANS